MFLTNHSGLHHCVDIDIKGFFDNVNHGKLLKQIWTLGIRDKKLLSIISTLIKAEIKNEEIPTKGTPQGGILSPLLSNIVLNELDWWISNQWETFETERKYAGSTSSAKYQALKKTKLKEAYIVRYADDFKILCRTRSQAIKIKIAVEKFLKERLQLECSEEKTKVINLKKNWSEFLGFQIKVYQKGYNEIKQTKRVYVGRDKTGKRLRETITTGFTYEPKYVTKSRMSPKSKANAKKKISEAIKAVQKSTTVNQVRKYNATVMGIQNYYKIATLISKDLNEINFHCRTMFYNRLNGNTEPATLFDMTKTQQIRYKDYKPKLLSLGGVAFVPVYAQKHKSPMNFTQEVCNYTLKGRELIHQKLMLSAPQVLMQKSETYLPNRSIEYYDNRISKFISQYGKCFVTGNELGFFDWHCHHIIPFYISKDDSYKNLVILEKEIHKLIHMTDPEKIQRTLSRYNLDGKSIKKVNALRKQARLDTIKLSDYQLNVA
jgi:hypothetical protein